MEQNSNKTAEFKELAVSDNLLRYYKRKISLSLGIIFLFLVVSFVMPFYLYSIKEPKLIFAIAYVVISLLILGITINLWIKRFVKSIKYKLSNDEIEWNRGIFFQKTSIVPYSKITNIDISQGPLQRKCKIATLKIQTAGYSNPQHGNAELYILGMENFKEIRDSIMRKVVADKPTSNSSDFSSTYINTSILGELIKIRQTLETTGN